MRLGHRRISIHAPAKGATNCRGFSDRNRNISIHAPAKGATYRAMPELCSGSFQSTLPRRERRGSARRSCRCAWTFQSTLPRRERLCTLVSMVVARSFQSTLPRRERRTPGSGKSYHLAFQSTLPRRERRSPLCRWAAGEGKNFNPRSREGSDAMSTNAATCATIFQSTLP